METNILKSPTKHILRKASFKNFLTILEKMRHGLTAKQKDTYGIKKP